MFDLTSARQRRIDQFAHYLRLMYHRAHEIVGGSCFIIFSEDVSDEDIDGPALHAKVPVAALIGDDGFLVSDGETPPGDNFWRPDHGKKRFVQFSFERQWFCVDMPRSTLFKPEAERILRERSGFFYLRDLPQFTLYGEDTEGHDPFRKVYLYGDERTAAEDMAFIFFDVWKFPVDARLRVKASAFGDGPTWEKRTLLE